MKSFTNTLVVGLSIALLISLNLHQCIPHASSLKTEEKETIETFEYLIITDTNLETIFQRLVSYKSQFLTSKLVNISSIISNPEFNGRDLQETIRNFISYAHQHWQTKYVLLGGDESIIPHRALFGSMIDWKGIRKESQIPSDLYYGCLNGTWDDDEDNKFGERKKDSITDEADFHAEVIIGRAPVENRFEASVFINKVISYETSDKPSLIKLHHAGLNPDNNPSSTYIINKLLKLIPDTFSTNDIFYSTFQNITIQKWIDAFKEGHLIIQHIGNGDYSFYELDNVGETIIWNIDDVPLLRNNFFPIHISLACHIGNFVEDDCIAEKMLLHPSGGISAFLGNTDYGATDIENPHYYSGEFLEQQFYEIFNNDSHTLGEVNQNAKEFFSTSARLNERYRWCYYALNLLGDPETPIFEKRVNNNQDIILVDDDFTKESEGFNQTKFQSIQEAIDQSNENTLILVYNGEYHEHLVINKSVFLVGTNRNYENDYTYSGLTILDGDNNGNTLTITADHVIIDGFTVTNSGSNGSGILIQNVVDANLYRCNIIRNKGNGITIDNSQDCIIENCIISFNDNHGVELKHASSNTIDCSFISYQQNNAGIYLYDSHHNLITGKNQIQSKPIDFYIASLYQHKMYDLSNRTELLSFSKSFIMLFFEDILDQLYYFPTYPPEENTHLISTEYLYLVKNKFGVFINKSIHNNIQHTWIQENDIGIYNSDIGNLSNRIIHNFISGNNIGLIWTNTSFNGFEINNVCYNKDNIQINQPTTDQLENNNPHILLIKGNLILNNDSFFPLFEGVFINKHQFGHKIMAKINSIVNMITWPSLVLPIFLATESLNNFNQSRSLLQTRVLIATICMMFPFLIKLIKSSNQPPIISELYY